MLASFDKMPDWGREVAILADVEAFSYKEIAGTLGVPMGTVMTRLCRAMKMLRAELAEFAQKPGD